MRLDDLPRSDNFEEPGDVEVGIADGIRNR